jgi:hypothetical protein
MGQENSSVHVLSTYYHGGAEGQCCLEIQSPHVFCTCIRTGTAILYTSINRNLRVTVLKCRLSLGSGSD